MIALAVGLVACGTAWSQSDSGYFERQRRMAELYVVELVESWIETEGVPGAVVAVVEESHVLLLEGFGVADTNAERRVDPGVTIFRVGDLVRAMTATAVLQLAEQGDLALDVELSQQPRLGSLALDSLGAVTPAQLLLHTAGVDPRSVATRAHAQADLMDLGVYLERRMPPRVRPPGVVSIPSVHGYALAGRLVEVASGETFGAYLDKAVFSPLGMSNTAVAPHGLARGRVATGYRQGDEQLTVVRPHYPQTVPASTLLTTAADMAAWMRVVLSDGSLENHRILERRSLDRLLERQFVHHDSLPGRSLAFKEGSYLSPRELYLTATDNGFSAALVLLPHRHVGLFVAVNREIDLWDLIYRILDPFESPGSADEETPGAAEVWDGGDLGGFWQDVAVPKATAEKLVSLVRQDRIRMAADGVLTWRSMIFEPSGPRCFQERQAVTRLCIVEGPDQTRFAAIGDLVLEQLDWYESRPVQVLLWITFTAAFLAAGWPRSPLPKRHSALLPDSSFAPQWPVTLARAAATVHFLFIACLAVVLATELRTGAQHLLYGVPAFILVILSLPLVAAVLTLIAAAGLGPVWRSSRSSLAYRLRLTVLVLALVTFLPFLWSWNLLGFRI